MAIMRKASALMALVSAVAAGSANGVAYDVAVTTSSATGVEAIMAFDLLNPDQAYSHYVTISNFTSGGDLLECPTNPSDICNFPYLPFPPTSSPDNDPASSATGALPNSVSISDAGSPTTGLFTYYQNIVLGSSIKFSFEMFGDAGSNDPPDGFALTLVDAKTGIPMFVNAEENESILFLFSLGQACDTSYSTVVTCEAVRGVPEPKSLALTVAALLVLAISRRFGASTLMRRSIRT